MTEPDRLDEILAVWPDDLVARYDRWAATYDDDHDGWGWRGPELVVDAARRLGARARAGTGRDRPIVDAGCGTGRLGVALRRAGWAGGLVGVDLSGGMLAVAARSGVYDHLILCSLYDVPFADGAVGAVVSSGVFTHGHVGGEAFAELARVTRPGGLVSVTQRLDVEVQLRPHTAALTEAGDWEPVERTPPAPLHPGRDETAQTITTWRVCAPSAGPPRRLR
ncbi:MAG: methyltransferase domain-containing protein [Actinomycetota bacterium]